MPKIVWDKAGERVFETGVSKGVIYLEDGRYAPWNGLTSVSETGGEAPTPIYYDGQKITNQTQFADFAASITAHTFPDEMLELQGFDRVIAGAYIGEQDPKRFNMSYQTKVGNDLNQEAGYKIHILFNVTATPSDSTFASIADSVETTEFSWELSTVPEEVAGFRPTSHIVLDSRELPASILEDIELMLYGGVTANPEFPEFETLMSMLSTFYTIEIIDNKDGTWTAIAKSVEDISVDEFGEFTIDNIDAVFLDADTYEASSTNP